MKKMNLSIFALLSFLVVIVIGTVLLSLPISNTLPVASIIDNLFTSTSATCVTGLVTVTVAEQYNLFGQLVVLVLIQVGGVGLISFVGLVLSFRKKKLNLHDRKMIQSSFNKVELSGIQPFLIRVFKYVGVFELIGAILYSFRFIPKFGFLKGLYYSVFLSISAFCNAGIDPLGGTSLIAYYNDALVSLVTAALIICGGLGFIVWFEIMDNIREKNNLRVAIKTLSTHTKVVIVASFWLILVGMIEFLVVEYNTMEECNFATKLLVSFFQSVSYRTAGFSTFDFARLSKATLLFSCLFMLVGGSVGGTAGGVKVTVLAVIFIKLREYVKGFYTPVVNHKRIRGSTTFQAYFTVTVYLILIFCSLVITSLTFKGEITTLIFEVVSAIGTVGLSAGITSSLGLLEKIVIIFLMFFGRVGMLSLGVRTMKDINSSIEYADSGIIV